MLKKLLKLTALLLIPFVLTASGVFASGKMEAKVGESIVLQADNLSTNLKYNWVAKKGKEVVVTQTTPKFNYAFLEQGEYNISLVVTDASGNSKSSSVSVLVGERYDRPSYTTEDGKTVTVTEGGETIITDADGNVIFQNEDGPLSVNYTTLPEASDDGRIHLLGSGRVVFNITTIRSDIIEYRIDKNIFADSDGNGVANDDIDNSSDDSYLLGGSWQTEYEEADTAKVVPEITLVIRNGQKAKAQMEVVFDPLPVQTGDPSAVLKITPAPDSDGVIHLYDDVSTVSFYARPSSGKILEYRIDKNIFVDSNKDGNPANDVDNLNDISFKTGDVWVTEYNRTDDQIIAQLIVVGEGGKGSRLQREIRFGERMESSGSSGSSGATKTGIHLVADKSFVMKGIW